MVETGKPVVSNSAAELGSFPSPWARHAVDVGIRSGCSVPLTLRGILDNLDTELAESLSKASAAKEATAKQGELKNAKRIISEYIAYIKSEPLIAHVDSNPKRGRIPHYSSRRRG